MDFLKNDEVKTKEIMEKYHQEMDYKGFYEYSLNHIVNKKQFLKKNYFLYFISTIAKTSIKNKNKEKFNVLGLIPKP